MSDVSSERALKMAKTLAETRRTLPIALLRAREGVVDRFRPLLVENGVTEQQWRVLRVLQEIGHADASQLAQQSCILAPSLTRILKFLSEQGLITQRKDERDRRKIIVELSSKGEALIAAATPGSNEVYAEIESLLGPERIERLLDELEFVSEMLCRRK